MQLYQLNSFSGKKQLFDKYRSDKALVFTIYKGLREENSPINEKYINDINSGFSKVDKWKPDT